MIANPSPLVVLVGLALTIAGCCALVAYQATNLAR